MEVERKPEGCWKEAGKMLEEYRKDTARMQ
jgi:hypothetical protein